MRRHVTNAMGNLFLQPISGGMGVFHKSYLSGASERRADITIYNPNAQSPCGNTSRSNAPGHTYRKKAPEYHPIDFRPRRFHGENPTQTAKIIIITAYIPSQAVNPHLHS